MTISPYQRRTNNPSPKATAAQPKAERAHTKTTNPRELLAEVTALGVELYGGVEACALQFGLDPKKFARQVARVFYVAADASELGAELARIGKTIPPETRARYAAALEGALSSAWAEQIFSGIPAEEMNAAAVAPPLVEFPTPGPDLGRPQ